MRIAPQISGTSVVALGHFNPLIFRPEWFRDKEIILNSDYDRTKIQMIHSEVTIFDLPWGRMEVAREKFSITSAEEPLVRAQDFFVKAFQLLAETPISAVGINRDVHYDTGSQSVYEMVGDKLAPKDVWGDFVFRDKKRCGGLRALIMEQMVSTESGATRIDGLKGWMRIQVEPSLKVIPHGIFVQANDHYILVDGKTLSDGRAASELVSTKWQISMTNSEQIIDQIMGLGDAS